MKKSIFTLLIAGFCLLPLYAEAEKPIDTDKLKAKLAKIIPNRTPTSINPTPISGLYEVTYGVKVFYITADSNFLIDGELIDLESRASLTQKTQSAARKAVLDKVPADSMISFPPKTEKKHVMTVFTDIDCPYCVKLHNEIPQYEQLGIEVRYMLYPRSGPGTPSFKTAISAWCAEDNAEALTKAKNREKIESLTCDNPVADHYAIGQQVGVTGTPAIIFENGELMPGYRPAKDIAAMLTQMDARQKQQAVSQKPD